MPLVADFSHLIRCDLSKAGAPAYCPYAWKVWRPGDDLRKEKRFTPLIVYIVIAAAGYGLYSWFQAGLPWGWLILAISACIGTTLVTAKLSAKLTAKMATMLANRKTERYSDYLRREYSVERQTELLKRRPRTNLVRKFTMSYEALKAHVCKQFEK